MIIITLAYFPASAQASRINDYLSRAGLEITVIPSSPFYYFKLVWENLRLFFTAPDSETRVQLLLTFCDARLEEIYHEITKENDLSEKEQLSAILKRYQLHSGELEQIIQNVTVGSTELNELLEKHYEKKHRLREFINSRRENLGRFWINEISTAIFRSDYENETMSYKIISPPTVLGAYEKQELELYPLEKQSKIRPADRHSQN